MDQKPIRIVSDNWATIAQLSGSSASASTSVDNLKSSYRSKIWRSNATEAALDCQTDTSQTTAVVCLARCNLSPSVEMRVRVYQPNSTTQLQFDSGLVPVNQPGTLGNFNWGYSALGSDYHYLYRRESAYVCLWLPSQMNTNRVQIDINDPENPDGFLQVSSLVLGPYWSPITTADLGVQIQFESASKHQRSEAGDLRTQVSPSNRVLQFSLSSLDLTEGEVLFRELEKVGTHSPVLISLYPEHSNSNLERFYQIYGKLRNSSPMSTPYYNTLQQSVMVEEI